MRVDSRPHRRNCIRLIHDTTKLAVIASTTLSAIYPCSIHIQTSVARLIGSPSPFSLMAPEISMLHELILRLRQRSRAFPSELVIPSPQTNTSTNPLRLLCALATAAEYLCAVKTSRSGNSNNMRCGVIAEYELHAAACPGSQPALRPID